MKNKPLKDKQEINLCVNTVTVSKGCRMFSRHLSLVDALRIQLVWAHANCCGKKRGPHAETFQTSSWLVWARDLLKPIPFSLTR